jgi:SAM-dependent methyltransferase
MSLDPSAVEAQLIAYYDQEGDVRTRRPIGGERLTARSSFLEELGAAPRRVVEIGSGPGRDASAFREAGHRYTAVELSMEHARRCRQTGANVVRASARQLPFPDGAFDALWSMSVLMHVPNSAIEGALAELARVLEPGAVAGIGVWGGRDTEGTSDDDERAGRPPRLFSLRSSGRWRALLASIGSVDTFETFGDDGDFDYQWAVVRKTR